ncbi:HEAT repeat domain-containing protein [Almyronema epifaneia]|uniref:HEAT repeat domain-containing protein n=1 Tax=Almyronema epifaneia S1 TaxID=2991925 RepID=A0ABW6IFE6_9CYAN
MTVTRLSTPLFSKQRLLKIVNLRSGEGHRTLLMFAFYTATSMGILWLEVSSAALFLGQYGAQSLPLIYIFSAVVGFGLSFIYAWLQRLLPLRWVIVLIALLMALPLPLFWLGMALPALAAITVFVMRLWVEAIYSLNDLNVAVTANQLFNIREIKRSYPIISSGNLVADVLSGFSIYLLLRLLGLKNVIVLACLMMLVGGGILIYISDRYEHAFPESLKRTEDNASNHSTRRLRGSTRQYVILLFSFFALGQAVMYLVEFQYLLQLDATLDAQAIATFLGIFSGILGLMELLTQWFTSSRLIERAGVFTVTMLLPLVILTLGSLSLVLSWPTLLGSSSLLVGLVVLKFMDEWLRYTLVASTRPILFQPIPDSSRGRLQSFIGGIAEPLSMGSTGVGILLTIWFCNQLGRSSVSFQSRVFLLEVLIAAAIWLGAIFLLRSRYLNLLVLSAERGLLSFSDANLRVLKRAFIEQLEQPGREADKRSCVELLSYIDPSGVGDVLAPLLPGLSASLQKQSLEAMLEYPSLDCLPPVRSLTESTPPPEVLALALRYIWIAEADPDINALKRYLNPETDPVVRGTAASLMLRRGNPRQKAEATNALRQMLAHPRERERVMGCRALGEADYMQALRLYIPNLLQDESLRVRRALLEAIAATRLEEYYPSLLKGLSYKSTRDAAVNALVRLGNEALPMLRRLAEDYHQAEALRNQAWQVIGQIGTIEALDLLVSRLQTAWGDTRRTILRILLRLSQETGLKRSKGIDVALDRLGRPGIERLLNQELTFMGQIYAGLIDISADEVTGREADLFRNALRDMLVDSRERLFMLMRFLYPSGTIQAAQVSLQGSPASRARGLEILDNTLDIPSKRAVLSVLDHRPDAEKLLSLANLAPHQPMSASSRLRYLMDLRHFLSDWAFACCFHLARQQQWSLMTAQTVAGLRHPTGFIREAVLAYLQLASPRVLAEVLPQMQADTNPLVAAQVKQLMFELGLSGDRLGLSQTEAAPGSLNLGSLPT